MESVVRSLVIYLFLLIVFRISGKRSLSKITTFDFVLLIIIAETTEQALLGEDHSTINAIIQIGTLVGIDIAFSLFKQKFKSVEKVVDSVPLIIFKDGVLLKKRADKERVSEEDVLEQARRTHGLERLDQIKYAIMEIDGSISIIPVEKS